MWILTSLHVPPWPILGQSVPLSSRLMRFCPPTSLCPLPLSWVKPLPCGSCGVNAHYPRSQECDLMQVARLFLSHWPQWLFSYEQGSQPDQLIFPGTFLLPQKRVFCLCLVLDLKSVSSGLHLPSRLTQRNSWETMREGTLTISLQSGFHIHKASHIPGLFSSERHKSALSS